MKIVSWNINGLRAVLKKGFKEFLLSTQADIVCLQEIKISEATRLKMEFNFPNYHAYWNSAERPGYSGTLILKKDGLKGFKAVNNGLGIKKFDSEGRVQVLEMIDFYLLNVYFPNSNQELSRLDYKLEFNQELLKYVKKLEKNKPVIITGDFNVAHQEIDLARPQANRGKAGFTDSERAWFGHFLKAGFIDSFRYINKLKIKYSWWSFRAAARERNVGWRIDYFCVSAKLQKRIKKADILDQVKGSDHAPIIIEL